MLPMMPSFARPSFRIAWALLILIAMLPLYAYRGEAEDSGTSIRLQNYTFNSPDITISVGTTVTWTNTDNDTHNVAFASGPQLFVSPVLQPGQSVPFTFSQAGTYRYFCEWHPFMQGKITVNGADGSANSTPAVPPRLFAETGKNVRGLFLDYWNTHGGLAQQGYPLSEETDGEVGHRRQRLYDAVLRARSVRVAPREHSAQRRAAHAARQLPLQAEVPGTGRRARPAAQHQPRLRALRCRRATAWAGKFLDYWKRHGGLAQQGYPISDEFTEKSDLDGKTYKVQYFERAVFEYHPENKPPYDVLLSQLGKFRYTAQITSGGQGQGIRSIGVSDGPEHYPLLAGPHAAAGVNALIYDHDPAPVVGWVNDLGVKWVLHQLSWYGIEPQKGIYKWELLDGAINALSADGVSIILNPVHAPAWSWATDKLGYPKDPADFARFMTAVAQRYKGKVAGYEIWNEPNLAHETGPYASTSHYAGHAQGRVQSGQSRRPGSRRNQLRRADTHGHKRPLRGSGRRGVPASVCTRTTGGELKGYFDVVGAHPGSNANPPETMWPDKPGPGPGWNNHGSFYFRRIEQIRQVMVDNGDARKQMWLTEFGWMSMSSPPAGFEYAAQNSEQKQADYLARALRMGRDQYPWMGPMLVFGLNFSLPNVAPDPTDERIGWSLLRRDATKRPSYFAVRDYALGK